MPLKLPPKTEVYKTIGDIKIYLHIFSPPDLKVGDQRPAILFFHGGSPNNRPDAGPSGFQHQSRYLASRGMVAFDVQYRGLVHTGDHRVRLVDTVKDAMAAVRWVRTHAGRLGVDPNRIAVSGASAGGLLAACAGTIDGLHEEGEDTTVSAAPNAMVIFSASFVLAPVGNARLDNRFPGVDLTDRWGIAPEKLSPYHHVHPGTPPTIAFYGSSDNIVPCENAVLFDEAMRKAGNRSELKGYKGQGHAFFIWQKNNSRFFSETMRQVDHFLSSLGWLQGEPTIEAFTKTLP